MDVKSIKSILNKEIISYISLEDLRLFTQQFSLLSSSGVAIGDILDILEESGKTSLKNMVARIRLKVEQGRTLSQALEDEKFKSSELLAAMVESGELSGKLGDSLKLMSNYYRLKNENRKEIFSELIYPIIVAIVSVLVVIFTMIFIMPTYASIFASRNADLPKITRCFLLISSFLRENYLSVIMIIIAFIATIILSYRKIRPFEYFVDRVLISLPLTGAYRLYSFYLHTALTIAILSESKVPILKITDVIKKSTNNLYIQEKVGLVERSLEKGDEVHLAFDEAGIFSKLFITMLKTGEKSGRLAKVMEETAYYYNDKLKESLKRTSKMLGPLIILVMALVVGFIVFSISLPMFEMINMV